MWQLLAGAGLNALGGILGAQSAKKGALAAANLQAGQAGENAALAGELPYRLNPYLAQSAEQWSQNVRDQAGQAAAGVTQAGQDAAGLVTGTAQQAGAGLRGVANQASSLLDPYGAAGTGASQSLLDLTAGLNAPAEKFQFSEDDPSYQWRLQQGQQALERSAAGRGGLQSGATLKALTNYSQGAASQEYQAAFKRFMEQQQHGLDRTKVQADTLSGLANRGLLANTSQGKYLTDAEQQAGDWAARAAGLAGGFTTQAANQAGQFGTRGAEFQSNMMNNATGAQIQNIFAGEQARAGLLQDRAAALAGGQVGAANAQANMWGGLGKAFGGALTMSGLMGQNQPGTVSGYDWGTGGISPADEYYKQNPWQFQTPGPPPPVNRGY
jgi:hypothetical protein